MTSLFLVRLFFSCRITFAKKGSRDSLILVMHEPTAQAKQVDRKLKFGSICVRSLMHARQQYWRQDYQQKFLCFSVVLAQR